MEDVQFENKHQQNEFLGHEVNQDGILTGKGKIVCIENIEVPKSVHGS